MKKAICLITSVVMILGMSVNVMAVDTRDTTNMTPEELEFYQEYLKTELEIEELKKNLVPSVSDQLHRSLSPDEYGGMYNGKDGTLHIIPVDNVAVQNALMKLDSRSKDSIEIIIIDEPVSYSLQELNDALERVANETMNWDFLVMVALNETRNSLDIISRELNDEQRQIIVDLAGIDGIEFISEEIIFDELPEGSQDIVSDDNKSPRGAVMARAGS